MSTQKKYTEEYLAAAQPELEEAVRKRKEADEKLKAQIDASIDAAAASSSAVYEREIEQAPLDSRAQYDANAMREAITRKQIEESLANMGMTDSGLSSSMHTALAVQRSRADNDVRVSEQRRIQAAQSAIDEIMASAATRKGENAIEIDRATSEWEQNAALEMQNSAMTAGASAYAADVKASTDATEMALDYQNKRASMAQSFINKGQDAPEAWAQAYYAYPDTSTVEGIRYAYYNQQKANGYSSKYVGVMSNAYINAIASGKTAEQADIAATSLLLTKVEAEANKTGMQLTPVTLTDVSAEEAIARMNWLVEDSREACAAYANRKGLEVTSDCVEYLTAQNIGASYMDIATDANAQQIGEALARNFSGIYFEIALTAAGLEYK